MNRAHVWVHVWKSAYWRKVQLSRYNQSEKCGTSLYKDHIRNPLENGHRTVCTVWKWLQNNTDIHLISPPSQIMNHFSLLSMSYYCSKLSHRKETWLNCIISVPIEVSLLLWFYVSVCSNKELYRDISASAVKLLNTLPMTLFNVLYYASTNGRI